MMGVLCPQCGAPIPGGAAKCEYCGAAVVNEAAFAGTVPGASASTAKKKKPFFKKWWFWAIVAVIAIGMIGGSPEDNDTSTDDGNGSSITQSGDETTKEETDNKTEGNKVAVADFSTLSKADIENWASINKLTIKFSEDYSDTVPAGSVISQSKKANETINEGSTIKVVLSKGKKPSIEYQNALKKAETYSNLLHMSKKAIYNQLTSEYGEKFPADAAQYAIDNLNADYKANALAKAKTYQQTLSMSKNAIYDQLISEYGEQFTAEEAQFAIDHLDD